MQPDHIFLYGDTKLPRTFEDMFCYKPGWRHNWADYYLKYGVSGLYESMHAYKDQYVRDLLEFRRNKPCANHESLKFAWNCHSNNETTGLASLLKALAVAHFSSEEIATLFDVTVGDIEMFLRLFWDAQGCFDWDLYMFGFLFQFMEPDPLSTTDICEGLLLMAAWRRGRAGIEQLVTPTVAPTTEERAALLVVIAGDRARKKRMWEIESENCLWEEALYDRYIKTLERLCALKPPAADGEREVHFKEVMAKIAGGTSVHDIIKFRGTSTANNKWPIHSAFDLFRKQ